MKHILTAVFFMLPALAHAHTGGDAGIHHGSAFLLGMTHPYTGLDHMAAMLAVGVWSMQTFRHAGRQVWALPAAFAGLLLVGGIAGLTGIHPPIVEPVIAASLLVLGLFVTFRTKLSLLAGTTLVGAFAIFHGLAHGSELPAQQALAALSGMVIGTMLLHIVGMLLGRFVLERHVWLSRMAGAAVAVLGVGLLAGAF